MINVVGNNGHWVVLVIGEEVVVVVEVAVVGIVIDTDGCVVDD